MLLQNHARVLCTATSLLLLHVIPSYASMCGTDESPAATLLLPYFEVNLDDPSSGNTLFTINNAFAEPALAHVTFWTDWSHPTIDFDVFLTGYDVLQVNLGDIFMTGNLPITADLQSDPQDLISPHGGYRSDDGYISNPRPEWDGSFQECQDFFPFYSNPMVRGQIFGLMVNGHTGQPVTLVEDACLGADLGDNIARGYITIDRVNRCSVVFPSEQDRGYFAADGTGIASNVNQLWGDWFFVDRYNGFAHGDSLVHIEALDGFDAVGDGTSDATVPDPATGYTFFGRYTAAGEDNREPLGITWATRYLNNDTFSPGGTDLYVWRDATVDESGPEFDGYSCGNPGSANAGPNWHPLDESNVLAFDEYENVVELCAPTGCPFCLSPPVSINPHCFPVASQKMSSENLAFEGWAPPWGAGWLFVDLRLPGDDGSFDGLSQSYVSAVHSAQGLFSVGLPAVELSSACSTFDDSQIPDV
ncbi:MAG: hypothetical protein MPN21_27005 [Thermoanaerobaculia bacterium]|nr:hypothetical protein [Thermoanaerobaculia bacterium]